MSIRIEDLRIDGAPMSGSLFDFGLFAFHNATALAAKGLGPFWYLPKLQCFEEAALWDEVMAFAEVREMTSRIRQVL